MALSHLQVTSDGTLTTLDVSFEYFDRTEIGVYFDSVPQTEGPVPSGTWQWGSGANILFDPAVPDTTVVRIQRTTDASALRHEFSQGSEFTADTLDENFRQVLHVVQESQETNQSQEFFGDINMNGHQVLNLGPATQDNHAISLGDVKQRSDTAWAAATAAAFHRDKAQAWATSPSEVEPGLDSARTYALRTAADVGTTAAALAAANAARDTAVTAAGTATTKAAEASASASTASTGASTATTKASEAAASAADAAASAASIANADVRVMGSYSAIRAYTGAATAIDVSQRGYAGRFYRNDTDTTTADDGATVLVSSNGVRWFRDYTGPANIQWWGVLPTNTAATNTTNMAAAAAWLTTSSAVFDTGGMRVPRGEYLYNTSPNWAAPRAFLCCDPGTVLRHMGSGIAVNFDGGATGGGVFVSGLLGRPLIRGNASTTHGLYVRAVHRGRFEARTRECPQSGASIIWNVCTEFDLRNSPLGEPSHSPATGTGVLIQGRNSNEYTSACTFVNTVMEGCSAYGINIQGGIMNTFIGGTSESNAGGIAIGAGMFGNTFQNMDCEFNTGHDLFCAGSDNYFYNLLADKLVEFTSVATNNLMEGGRVNTLTDNGANEFRNVLYGLAGGAFTPSANTVHRGMRNAALGGAFLPNYDTSLRGINAFGATAAQRLLVGRADQITGGTSNEVDIFKTGTGALRIGAAGAANSIVVGGTGLGFFNATPVGRRSITGAKAGNTAVASVIQAGVQLGLWADSTT